MNLSLSDIVAVVTAVVAVAGLVLSIYNFYLARKDKVPNLKAGISNGFLPRGPELGDVMVLLEVANTGERPVKISAAEIKWRKNKIVFLSGIPGTLNLPAELSPGDSATFWVPAHEVARTVAKQGGTGQQNIRACFRSAVGTEYVSRNFKFHVEEWLRLSEP